MPLRNPFEDMAYLTEKGIQPERVLERYSFKPFLHVFQFLTQKINCYAIGRTGVGKTMILSLFDSKYQKVLFSNTNGNEITEDRKKLIESIPNGIISVFLNIDTPNILFTRFQGHLQNEESWQANFGDYIGHILLQKLLFTLEDMNDHKKWREHSDVRAIDQILLDRIALQYFDRISKLLPAFSSSEKTWASLKTCLDSRIKDWINAISQLGNENFTGPKITLQLIQPCLVFMDILRDTKAIGKECRLFIIIDQYETLYEHKDFIDFRPVFNSAMRQAARGGTQIEFKIGVRPYGYLDNLKIFQSDVKIDIGRECIEIKLDELAENYYKEFINDLVKKCLKQYPEYNEYSKDVSSLFENYSPIQEVKYYLGKSKSFERHFGKFFKNDKLLHELNMDRKDLITLIESFTSAFTKKECKIWLQTLLSINTEKLINRKKKIEEINETLKRDTKLICSILASECHDCKEETCKKGEDDDIKERWRYDHIKPGALFLIASAYQNKKLYSGYKTLNLVSSNIVLHFVEIVSEAFIMHLLKQKKDFKPISVTTQSKAIYSLSNRFFENITDKTSYGLSIRNFLLKLGYELRNYQLKPDLYLPTANGIMLNTILTKQFPLNEKISPSDKKNSSILVELLSYGFIEERGLKYSPKKWYKYYFNRLLCPYFGLALEHYKNPLSISEERDFIECLLDKDCPTKKLRNAIKYKTKEGEKPNIQVSELDKFFD